MTQVALQVAAAGAINKENDVRVVSGLDPIAVAATTNGIGVDLSGYEAANLVLQYGVCTDGEYTITVEHSDDDGVGDAYATVDCLDTAPTVVDSMTDEFSEIRRVRAQDTAGNPITLKRWVRVVVTESMAGVTGVVMSAAWILGAKRTSIGDNVA